MMLDMASKTKGALLISRKYLRGIINSNSNEVKEVVMK